MDSSHDLVRKSRSIVSVYPDGIGDKRAGHIARCLTLQLGLPDRRQGGAKAEQGHRICTPFVIEALLLRKEESPIAEQGPWP
jgi:hypothetical protein